MNGMLPKQIGQTAEMLAAQYLIQQQVRIVEKNFYCKRGEIDLIGWLSGVLIFFEVRHRKSTDFIHPLETITHSKQRKLISTAHFYLNRFKSSNLPNCRFDILSATGSLSNLNWEWIQGAFEVQFP